MIRYALAGPDGFLLGIFHRADGAPAPAVDAGSQAVLVPDSLAAADDIALLQGYMGSNGSLVPLVPSLAMARQSANQAAAVHFDGLFYAPNGFTYQGALYQIDADSQANIAAMGSLAAVSISNPTAVPWPGGFYWIAADNSHAAMTAADMLAFAAAVAGYVSACILRFRAIKDSIMAAPTAADVQAIDVTAGYATASN